MSTLEINNLILSQKSKQSLGRLFVISAPSGAGKSSLVKALCSKYSEICVSISHTTRKIRPSEINGVHYHFITGAEFQNMLNNDEFIEYACVYDNYYGTQKKFLQSLLASGKNVILEIDWQGAFQVKHIFNEATLIYIMPPSLESLKQRLTDRGTDSEAVIKQRLDLAYEDMRHAKNFEFVVINEDFNTALHDLYSIIKALSFNSSKTITFW